MFDLVDDSSRSIQGYTHYPNFQMLDARIASALNKIIQNSNFKKKKKNQSGELNGKFGCMEPSPFHMARLGKRRRIKAVITKFGCICLTSMPEPMNARHGTISLSVYT